MDERTGGRRTKAHGIKKPDERSDERVNRTKDEESRRGATGQIGWSGPHGTLRHTLSLLRRREGALPRKRERNLLFIGAPGYLTADPDTGTATPVP